MIICAALSVVGFGVVLGTKGMDDLFTTFGSVTTTELDEALIPHIIWRNADLDHPNITNTTTSTTSSSNKAPRATSSSHSQDSSESTSKDSSSSSEHHSSSSSSHEEVPRACTLRKLAGSFGGICMEDNLNANMFVVQLSHWNNARDTLWFLAMVYSVLSLLFAFLIHIQRNPSSQTGFPALTPEKQQEFMAMTPAQQQAFMQQLQLEQGQAAQQQSQGCCGRKGVEVYDTPYYEFFRFAWLFVGLPSLSGHATCLSPSGPFPPSTSTTRPVRSRSSGSSTPPSSPPASLSSPSTSRGRCAASLSSSLRGSLACYRGC
ncbi:hypothetical protein AGDE_15227 [Angomonas deanei]|nr:hypothetical protein AGDE_15227 [Angomonas deanei]|eukprot:EPY19456.1 hypothetical protein AGDE_15227 [Angomonas deanei]